MEWLIVLRRQSKEKESEVSTKECQLPFRKSTISFSYHCNSHRIIFRGVAPIFAISFFGFGVGKKVFADGDKPLNNTRLFLAGAFSGIFTTSVMAPGKKKRKKLLISVIFTLLSFHFHYLGERIKCLLQIQQGAATQKYSGMVDCAKQLYREGGIRSIYKGSLATLLRGK